MADETPPPPPSGWTRITFKSKFGAGRDFNVLDEAGNAILLVDGKLGPKPKAEVQDPAGNVLFNVKGRMLGIPKRMNITRADGTEVAELHAKAFSMIKNKMTMNFADGSTWEVEGSLMEKNYTINSGGQPIARISQKWLTMRDSYAVEFVDSLEPGLVMAVIWAIDRWVERD